MKIDACYTSYLKRAIHTLNLVLEQMDCEWIPVTKTWKLNERHYGALQGLNKTKTAEKYGEAQVKIWRRSYAVKPRIRSGETILIAAHGNSIRALIKYLEHLSEDEIMKINVPTGAPLVYEFNRNGKMKNRK